MEDWKDAGDEELRKILFSAPPIKSFVTLGKFNNLRSRVLNPGLELIGTLIFNTILESRTLKGIEYNNRMKIKKNLLLSEKNRVRKGCKKENWPSIVLVFKIYLPLHTPI
jgi:hypothetical protein